MFDADAYFAACSKKALTRQADDSEKWLESRRCMDAIKNPFSPGAGSPPPELVGHEGILEQARILLGRIKARRPEKSILLTGLRGVGKTVLLNEIERMAAQTGYRTLSAEAHEDKSLAALLVPPLRKLLFELDRVAGAGNWSGSGAATQQ